MLFLFQGSLKEKTLENLEKYVVKDVSVKLLYLRYVTKQARNKHADLLY